MSSTARDSNVVITGCGWVLGDRSGSAAQLADATELIRSLIDGSNDCALVSDAVRDRGPSLNAEVKADKGAWMTAVAIEHALSQAGLSREAIAPERTGLVIGSALAGQLGMIEFAGEVREQTPRFVSPLHFPQTVGNYMAGAIARAYDLKGPNVTIASGTASGLDAIIEGCELLEAGDADVVLAGVTEVRTDALAQAFSNELGASVEGAVWFVLERMGGRQGIASKCVIHSWSKSNETISGPRELLGSLSGPLTLMGMTTIGLKCESPETLNALIDSLANRVRSPDQGVWSACAGSHGMQQSCVTIRVGR